MDVLRPMLDALDALGGEFREPNSAPSSGTCSRPPRGYGLSRPIWTVAADRPHSGWADRTAVQSAHLRR
jgi:hypothetical protein